MKTMTPSPMPAKLLKKQPQEREVITRLGDIVRIHGVLYTICHINQGKGRITLQRKEGNIRVKPGGKVCSVQS